MTMVVRIKCGISKGEIWRISIRSFSIEGDRGMIHFVTPHTGGIVRVSQREFRRYRDKVWDDELMDRWERETVEWMEHESAAGNELARVCREAWAGVCAELGPGWGKSRQRG